MLRKYRYLLLALLLGCEPDRSALVGDAEVDQISFEILSTCEAPFPVRFQPVVRFDEEDSYAWDFGDGTTSAEKAPLHEYKQPGLYEVNLSVGGSSRAVLVDIQNTGMVPGFTLRSEALHPNTDLWLKNEGLGYDSIYWEYRIGGGDTGKLFMKDLRLRVISLAPIEITQVLLCKSGAEARLTETFEVAPYSTRKITIDYLRYLPSFQQRAHVDIMLNGEKIGDTHQKSNELTPLDWTLPKEMNSGTNIIPLGSDDDEVELALYIDGKLQSSYLLNTPFMRDYRPTWIGFPYDPFFDTFNVRFSYEGN